MYFEVTKVHVVKCHLWLCRTRYFTINWGNYENTTTMSVCCPPVFLTSEEEWEQGALMKPFGGQLYSRLCVFGVGKCSDGDDD